MEITGITGNRIAYRNTRQTQRFSTSIKQSVVDVIIAEQFTVLRRLLSLKAFPGICFLENIPMLLLDTNYSSYEKLIANIIRYLYHF